MVLKSSLSCLIAVCGGFQTIQKLRISGTPINFGLRLSFIGWTFLITVTGRERLIRSHSSERFCFELSGNSN